jgi:uncharacterized damage-inducible protein DinB
MRESAIVEHALRAAGYQVAKVFEAMPEALRDAKLGPEAMSPRDTAVHLTECYHAALAALEGREHQWGSYVPPSYEWDALISAMTEARARAAGMAAASGDPEAAKLALDFLGLHDAYHAGQIAQLRIHQDPGWDPYSIYEHH